ncbi:cytochrome c-550 PedF [Marinobacter confluentis]|uniref:Cytochrome c-550 PedF n=1 Tax=Marinobacter confluentis TaxID=1697557 RepID=A0A4Z1BSA6_9GAMM|nr:cytochrome c-550 PedF [Marinobacter confluentis]TGN40585.1 cytochrome c-550 PedF [Marinobacter confluentis]
MPQHVSLKLFVASGLIGIAGLVFAHGNVTPQEVDTGNLPELGTEVRTSNPFREDNEFGEFNAQAVKVGESGYAGNCAVCHGIRAMSGGLTPDLRELTEWDDEYFVNRVLNGTGRGMPSFRENLDQNAIWAIKTYVESVPKPE